MELRVDSRKSDGLADLARAAYALATSREKMCFWFLEQSKKKIGKIRIKEVDEMFKNGPPSPRLRRVIAEKILDEYYRRRWER